MTHALQSTDREALEPFVVAANALGPQAADLGAIVQEAWAAQRDFLLMATMVRRRGPNVCTDGLDLRWRSDSTSGLYINTNTAGHR